MSPIRLVFTIRGDTIPPRGFAEAIRLVAELLEEVDAANSPNNQPTMRWHLGKLGSGSAVVPYIGTGRQADIDPNVNVPLLCVRGVRELEEGVAQPAVFRREEIGHIHQIGRMIQNGVSGFRLEVPDSGAHAEITPTAAAHAQKLLARAYTLGAVEGRLEAVNTHGSLRFTVWDDVSGYSVRCRFDDSLFDEVVEALRMRTKVLVTGRVRRDPDGRPREIREITELRQLVAESQPRSVLDLEGVYSAMEGTTLDYLAEIRGE